MVRGLGLVKVADVVIFRSGIAWRLGWVRKGMKVTFPRLKSFL
jgi:hypothetical protein